jgi:hypothetical protein
MPTHVNSARRFLVGFLCYTVTTGVCLAQTLCNEIETEAKPSNFWTDINLFYRLKATLGDEKPKWRQIIPFADNKLPLGQRVTFAYVIHPVQKRNGALNIRVRTEAAGNENDTSKIRINRAAYAEPCGFFGRTVRRGPYERVVPTLTYEEYHQVGKSSTALRNFHFEYRNDDGRCTRTDADDRRETFEFARVEGPLIRAVHVAGLSKANSLGSEYVLDLRQAFLSPLSLLSGTAEAAPNRERSRPEPVVSDPNAKHYSQLQSYLRKYDAAKDVPACSTFWIQTQQSDSNSYVSINDLDDGASLTWSMNWIPENRLGDAP